MLGLVSKTPIALMLLFYKLYNIEHLTYILLIYMYTGTEAESIMSKGQGMNYKYIKIEVWVKA